MWMWTSTPREPIQYSANGQYTSSPSYLTRLQTPTTRSYGFNLNLTF